jgi:hypothetical protein
MATTYSERAPQSLAGTAAKASLYPLAILFLIQAVDQMNRFLPAALFPALKRQFALSDFRLGSLSSAFVPAHQDDLATKLC